MVTKEICNLANEIFRVDPKILHLGLIDLEGHVLLDQSTGTPEPIEPGQDRIMFYYQVGLSRSRREQFNDVHGKTTYVHIMRGKMQQLVLYLPMITVYLTLERTTSPDNVKEIADKIRNIGGEAITVAIKSHIFYSSNQD